MSARIAPRHVVKTTRIETSSMGNERLKAVSTEDLRDILRDVKREAGKNMYMDTLAALVTDVNATTEVLRRGIKKYDQVVEYKLRIASPLHTIDRSQSALPFPTAKRRTPPVDERASVERISQEFGIHLHERDDSWRRTRSRSGTPCSRRLIQIEASPPPQDGPICAACGQSITGACITALAPNSERAQKFHPQHFVCTYCTKPLNLKGTYKEHQRKPYCHECFYRLYSGHIYGVEEKKY